jgi:hypothetical protein
MRLHALKIARKDAKIDTNPSSSALRWRMILINISVSGGRIMSPSRSDSSLLMIASDMDYKVESCASITSTADALWSSSADIPLRFKCPS